MKKQKIKFLIKETYLSVIKNSVGSKTYRSAYAKVNGRKKDILENGNLSCAYFVSSILTVFKLINTPHTTVKSTIKDMQKNGWHEIKRPRNDCVLVWGEKYFKESGETHSHIGFYIGKQKAISNNSKKSTPTIHSYKKHDGRTIEKIFWHSKLD